MYEASCRSCGWKGKVCGLSAIGIRRGVYSENSHNKQRNRAPTASPIAKLSIGWKPLPLAPFIARRRRFLAHSWNVRSVGWAKISGPKLAPLAVASGHAFVCRGYLRPRLSKIYSTLGTKYAQLFLCWLLGRMPPIPSGLGDANRAIQN